MRILEESQKRGDQVYFLFIGACEDKGVTFEFVQKIAHRFRNTGVVVIRDFAFHPAELRVPAGTRVTWVNCERESNGRAAHTSTADAGRWSSPLLAFQARYTTTLTEPGTFAYHCEPHPSMRGTVVVE